MKQAKNFSFYIFAGVLSYGSLSFYLLPQATFQGDLTRLGMISEVEFGWRKPQPQIDSMLFKQSTLQDADVLVIGDSFSDNPGQPSLVWQTVLTQHKLKVRTEHWGNFGGICADFMPWLRKQGFKGKYLIVETVERGLMTNIDNSVGCKQTQYRSHHTTDIPRNPPVVSFDVNDGNYAGKLSTGLRTQFNLIKYNQTKKVSDFTTMSLPNKVNLTRVKNGCELFSHHSCSDALFLGEDQSPEIDKTVLEKIEILNSRLTGINLIWVIVPNKSTAYLYPDKQFWNKAEQRIHAPNLLRMTHEAINRKVIDLYPANNTHFSTTGYLMMGDLVYRSLQEIPSASTTKIPANASIKQR